MHKYDKYIIYLQYGAENKNCGFRQQIQQNCETNRIDQRIEITVLFKPIC